MSAQLLIVDDSTSMRQMVAFALTSGGFDVTEAEDGQVALGRAQGQAKGQGAGKGLAEQDERAVAQLSCQLRRQAVDVLWTLVRQLQGCHLPLREKGQQGCEQAMAAVQARQQQQTLWQPKSPRRIAHICILGLGELGAAAARHFEQLGYQVSGWARTAKQLAGIQCYSGAQSLAAAVAQADVVICLLPLTPATESLLGSEFFHQLKAGTIFINVARGAIVDDEALFARFRVHIPVLAGTDPQGNESLLYWPFDAAQLDRWLKDVR